MRQFYPQQGFRPELDLTYINWFEFRRRVAEKKQVLLPRFRLQPSIGGGPVGRMADAIPQLHRVVAAVMARDGGHPVALVAHSWGTSVAAHYAGLYPQELKALVLFAPIATRAKAALRLDAAPAATAAEPSHFPLTQWAQYRRFIEDVPRGHPQVLSEVDVQAWANAVF